MITSLKQPGPSRLEIFTLLGLLCLPLWFWLGWVKTLPEPRQALPYLTIHTLLWLAQSGVLFASGLLSRQNRPHQTFSSPEWRVVLVFSLLFHLIAAFGQPILETDPWRYLWDGKQLRHGINPYLTAPSDSTAFSAPPPYFNKINHPHLATIYPPLAQAFFWLSALFREDSLWMWKLICIALSFTTFGLLASALSALGRDPKIVLFLMWNPLWIKEFANSAHMDLVMLSALAGSAWALATGRQRLAVLLLGLSALGKLVSLALLPAFAASLRRLRDLAWIPLILGLGYLPFMLGERWIAPFESLLVFGQEWIYHAFLHDIVLRTATAFGAEWANGMKLGRLTAAIVLAAAAWFAFKGRIDPARALNRAWWMFTVFLLTSQVIFPWYVSWALMMAVFARSLRAAWWWTLLAPLAYTYYINESPILWLKYLSFAWLGWVLWTDFKNERRTGSQQGG